ncbi:MAG: sulfatase-like hydrolase/transferase [Defluviitaleaceae bacterium]|nr:sulfatase-like hydrolase/transferase [Defluviitaleaceae bacterium]
MPNEKPNVIFIYADDLGRGMLGCYGQKLMPTPNIDRLCADGVRFDNAYGCHICAPARASLLCGIHDCHQGGWAFTAAGIYIDYSKGLITLDEVEELIHNTGMDKLSGENFLGTVFKKAGYVTGQVGKLDWGFSTTAASVKKHDWDYHYGYYDHQMCHGFYPPFLHEDGILTDIPGNTLPDCGIKAFMTDKCVLDKSVPVEQSRPGMAVYSQDLFDEKMVAFIRKNKDNPFFLYHPSQLPHGQLSIPDIDPRVAGDDRLTAMEKVFASMVLRLDDTVGVIRTELETLGLLENTMIIFSADNGHAPYYAEERTGQPYNHLIDGRRIDHLGVRYTTEGYGDIYDGNDGFTGIKESNFEGGARVPLIVSWPGHTKNGSSTDKIVANYDFMATMADMLGVDSGPDKDGVSYMGLISDGYCFNEHDYIVYAGSRGPAIVMRDGWKLRMHKKPNFHQGIFGAYWEHIADGMATELYYLPDDKREENNLAEKYPDKADALCKLLMLECDGNFINGTTEPHFVYYPFNHRAAAKRAGK